MCLVLVRLILCILLQFQDFIFCIVMQKPPIIDNLFEKVDMKFLMTYDVANYHKVGRIKDRRILLVIRSNAILHGMQESRPLIIIHTTFQAWFRFINHGRTLFNVEKEYFDTLVNPLYPTNTGQKVIRYHVLGKKSHTLCNIEVNTMLILC